jgi:Holliday junction resolvase RusA-like endonuclease
MMIRLPVPPSTNHLFLNVKGKGRIVAPHYAKWRTEAGWMLKAAKPQPFGKMHVQLGIFIPEKTRGDLSNRIKALEDLLVTHGVIDDDRQVKRITVEYHGEPDAVVALMPYGSPTPESRLTAARMMGA